MEAQSLENSPSTEATGSAAQRTDAAAARGPRRILFIEANEDGTVGGSHQMLYELATNLNTRRFQPLVLFYQDNVFAQRLRERGVDVRVYTDVRAREQAIRRSGSRWSKYAEFANTIVRRWQFLRKHDIELVHINNSPRVGDDDWLPACRLLGIPCVASVRGDASGPAPGWLRRRLFLSFSHYIPVSKYIADSMIAAGVRPERMDLVYDGVDLEAFRGRVRRPRQDVRQELGVAPDSLLAVMVGNIRHWKGQHVVLAALEAMEPAQRRTLKIAFAGAARPDDQAYLDELQALVARAGLQAQVSFLGARPDVPDLLNAADLAIHASVKPEPFGLVVIEAMALGKPVLAANLGGPAESVSPESGITYNPHVPAELTAALEALVRDPARRAALAAGAPARAEMFTVRNCVAKIERIYSRFLDS